MQGLTFSLLKRLEAHGLFVENVRGQGDDNRPVIYAITPTFARPVQKAELTRLAQTFLHVPNFHWILVEDAPQKTSLVTRFLETSGLIYTHLSATTPPNYKLGRNDPNWKKPRGVEQRNAALRWLRENLKPSDRGVVYFADDDNTYSIKLFREVKAVCSGNWVFLNRVLRLQLFVLLQLYYFFFYSPQKFNFYICNKSYIKNFNYYIFSNV